MKKVIVLFNLLLFQISTGQSVCNDILNSNGNSNVFQNIVNYFPITSNDNDISCNTSIVNSKWIVLKTENQGNLDLILSQGNNAPDFNNTNINYLCWGPFDTYPHCYFQLYDLNNYTNLNNNLISCSNSSNITENIQINNVDANKFYIILATNLIPNNAIKIINTGTSNIKTNYITINGLPNRLVTHIFGMGNPYSFSVNAVNATNYQWQKLDYINGLAQNEYWISLTDNATELGCQTSTLQVNYADNLVASNYRLKLTNNNDEVYTDIFTITQVLSNEEFLLNSISVVTSNETIKIETPIIGIDFELFTIDGKKIKSQKIENNFTEIDISDLSKSIYLIIFSKDHSKYSQKFIKD